jgi:hypothetical protein
MSSGDGTSPLGQDEFLKFAEIMKSDQRARARQVQQENEGQERER